MKSWVLALAMVAGCANGLKDERFATGSSTAVASADHEAVLAVNVDEGTVSRVDLTSGKVKQQKVGGEPTRIARAGDEFWVTLRTEGTVGVLDEQGGLQDVLAAGTEPVGVVSSENGRWVYVAASLSDEVIEFDAKKKEETRRFKVQDNPRTLALHPSGKVLFVASTVGGRLSAIDLKEGTVRKMKLPTTKRNTSDGEIELTPRITGDPTVSPDGEELAVPVMYVDNVSSVDTPEDEQDVQTGGYGSSGLGVSRMNPTLVTIPLDRNGEVDDGEEVKAILLAANLFDEERSAVLRSYPAGVTADPESRDYYVSLEGSEAVLAVKRVPAKGESGSDRALTVVDVATDGDFDGERPVFTSAEQGGFDVHPIHVVRTGPGPRSVLFTDEDRAWVHTFLDRSVADVGAGEAHKVLVTLAEEPFRSERATRASAGVELAKSALEPEVEFGRRLFYSAVDSRMAAAGSGVSCATCHFEGRNDGVTWTLEGEARQTPSLAGPVGSTAPVTWTNDVESVADEAMATSGLRMGGDGLQEEDARAVEAYVNFSRYPLAAADLPSKSVERGAKIFHREDVGCSTCHVGDLFTDNQSHAVIGSATQTPTLRGISASAPYFHDGSAKTLAEVLQRSSNGSMGDTSSLSKSELQDLENYLRSL